MDYGQFSRFPQRVEIVHNPLDAAVLIIAGIVLLILLARINYNGRRQVELLELLSRIQFDREKKFPPVEDDGPGSYKLDGVDRETKLDTTWQVEAQSRANARANARAKAELEGIIVTRVVKLEAPPKPKPASPPPEPTPASLVITSSPKGPAATTPLLDMPPPEAPSAEPAKPSKPWDDARIIRVVVAATVGALAIAALIIFALRG